MVAKSRNRTTEETMVETIRFVVRGWEVGRLEVGRRGGIYRAIAFQGCWTGVRVSGADFATETTV